MNAKTGWAKLKKHGAIPALALAVVLLFAIGSNAYAKKDKATFELKDLAGSRDAIADVVIGGELRDGYHSVHFRVEDGKLRTNTDIFRQPEMNQKYILIGDSLDPSVPTTYAVSTSETSAISIQAYTWKKSRTNSFDLDEAAVAPNIHYNSNHQKIGILPFKNGLAKIGDKVFFTPVLPDDTTGTSYIYLLNFGPWGFKAPPQSAHLAEISLDANQSPERPNIAVLGLEAVGDKLALLTAENNELVIRSYDSVSGQVLGEAAVPNFRLADWTGIKESDPEGTYDPAYEAFSDSGQDILNLDFKGSAGRRLMLSVGFSDGVQVACSILARYPEDGSETGYGASYLRYKNGKLYAIKTFQEPQNADNAGALKRPEHLYLYVYRQSKLIYQGELVTDWNDDREFDVQGGHDNDAWFDNRNFANVSID